MGNGQSPFGASPMRLFLGPVYQVIDRLYVFDPLEGRDDPAPLMEVKEIVEGNGATAIVPHMHVQVLQLLEWVTPGGGAANARDLDDASIRQPIDLMRS